ncbi:hypothetical protein [Methylocystis sp. ATCC 49242]|uniref:hypothetical protein n=1 Tax=Methylocystis sp. ATCC 49242 TaxID=622637 RepID=UPI0001F8738F|nr:hypothetical protein [Methylocystis sp. ATCC 49242]
MLWLIRFTGLLGKAVVLEFVHVFGLIVFLIAILLGYFRSYWWTVPALAIVTGFIADNFIDHVYLTDILERAVSANRRGAFVIIVYFAITISGYLAGIIGRILFNRRRRAS